MHPLTLGLVLSLGLSAADLFTAIRNGEPGAVKAALRAGADPAAINSDGLTPLMYAVMTAGAPVMRVLLDNGASVNAAMPNGITALHIAAYDLEKTSLLVERGASVNAATTAGETPLLVAVARPGTQEIAAMLVAKGADPNAKSGQSTALTRAALTGDLALFRLLIAKGARIADSPNLARYAAAGHCRECLRLALEGGADPNGATSSRRSALQDAAAFGDLEMVRMLIEKGADMNAADRRGYTALMRAALCYEPGSNTVVAYLLAQGAKTEPKNETGETALSLARRFGGTPIVAMLQKSGAPEPKTAIRVPPPLETNSPGEAVQRSLALLQRIGEPVRKLNKCTTCHNHTLPAMTVAMARARGWAIDEEAARNEAKQASAPDPGRLTAVLLGGGVPDFFPYQLIGIAAERIEPNAAIDGMLHHVSTRQDPSGRFRGMDYRPPQEYTDITFTATALRAMQLHTLPGRNAEMKDRVRRAARWLLAQTPRDTEEHALRLMGLSWAEVGKPARDSAAKELIALQRADGGWGQTATLASDAYATGQSLYALYLAGVPASHPAYRRGVDYLLKTQRKDGSWYVTSRSHPVQPLIDGGYPYINHQWISAAGGAWSTMAILATLPEKSASR